MRDHDIAMKQINSLRKYSKKLQLDTKLRELHMQQNTTASTSDLPSSTRRSGRETKADKQSSYILKQMQGLEFRKAREDVGSTGGVSTLA